MVIFCHFLSPQKVTKKGIRPELAPSRTSTSFRQQAVSIWNFFILLRTRCGNVVEFLRF